MQSTQWTNKYNAANNLLCMNARIERAMNSENLGTRIKRNGALDQKIRALGAFRCKTVFLGGSREILEFFEWLEGVLAQKIGALAKFGNFWGIFVDFWSI
jgi:hypothetical protein